MAAADSWRPAAKLQGKATHMLFSLDYNPRCRYLVLEGIGRVQLLGFVVDFPESGRPVGFVRKFGSGTGHSGRPQCPRTLRLE